MGIYPPGGKRGDHSRVPAHAYLVVDFPGVRHGERALDLGADRQVRARLHGRKAEIAIRRAPRSARALCRMRAGNLEPGYLEMAFDQSLKRFPTTDVRLGRPQRSMRVAIGGARRFTPSRPCRSAGRRGWRRSATSRRPRGGLARPRFSCRARQETTRRRVPAGRTPPPLEKSASQGPRGGAGEKGVTPPPAPWRRQNGGAGRPRPLPPSRPTWALPRNSIFNFCHRTAPPL